MMAGSTRRPVVVLVQVAVTVTLLAALLRRVDWPLLTEALVRTRAGFLSLAFLCFAGSAMLEVGRLRVMLASYRLGLGDVTRLHVVGVFFGSFFPGQLGADLFKVNAVRALDGSIDRPLTLILVLRVVGLIVVLAAALVSLLVWESAPAFRPGSWRMAATLEPSVSAILSALVLALVLALALLLALPRLRSRIVRRTGALLHRARRALLSVSVEQVASLLGFSVLLLALRVLVLYFLTMGVGFPVRLVDALPVVAFATLILLLPISFAGLGLREGVITVLLANLALPYEEAVLVAVLGRLFILVLASVGGVWLMLELIHGKKSGRDP